MKRGPYLLLLALHAATAFALPKPIGRDYDLDTETQEPVESEKQEQSVLNTPETTSNVKKNEIPWKTIGRGFFVSSPVIIYLVVQAFCFCKHRWSRRTFRGSCRGRGV